MADNVVIKFDFKAFAAKTQKIIDKLKDKEYLLRPVCIELIPLMTRRIHINGKATDGSNIGRYSDSYMRVRKKHRRTEPQSKVVIALTSQLENDWSVIPTDKGYAVGFLNKHNADKAGWVEENFGKKIFTPTKDEMAFVHDRLNELIKDAFTNS